MSWQEVFGLLSIIGAIVGGVWVLRSKLSDIEVKIGGLEIALGVHSKMDKERHENHEARIVRLEDFRGRR